MPENNTLECIKNNPPEALVPISKVFGAMIYISCYHIIENLSEIEKQVDPYFIKAFSVNFMTDYIDKDSAKYLEYDSVEEAVDTYLENSQYLVEHDVSDRKEILVHFIVQLLQVTSVGEKPYYLNDLTLQIRGRNCLAFIIDPLNLSRDEVYETLGGVDEALALKSQRLTEEIDWKKNNYLLRPAFISMLYPETLEPHFHAIASGMATVFKFDKVNFPGETSSYTKWVDGFSKSKEYPPDFDTSKASDYESREDALRTYTGASTELCRQYRPGAKAVLEYLILMILAATICGDITAEATPELFALVKELARPLKLSEAELRASIDDQVKYIDDVIFPSSNLESTSG